MKIATAERGRERVAGMGAQRIAHIDRRWRYLRQTVGQATTDGLMANAYL
jgi:hypothetical protein